MSFSYNLDFLPMQSVTEQNMNILAGHPERNVPRKPRKAKKTAKNCSYVLLFKCAHCQVKYLYVCNKQGSEALASMRNLLKSKKNTDNPFILHCRAHNHSIEGCKGLQEYKEKLTTGMAHSMRDDFAEKLAQESKEKNIAEYMYIINSKTGQKQIKLNKLFGPDENAYKLIEETEETNAYTETKEIEETDETDEKIPESKEVTSDYEPEEYTNEIGLSKKVEDVAKQYAELQLSEMKEEYEKKLLDQLKEIERLKSQIPK